MRRKSLKTILAAISITMIAGVFVGCGANSKEVEEGKDDNLSGIITAVGSTALQPLVEQASKNFKIKHPNVVINVQGGGSGTGINQVAEGFVEIGNSDISAESKLKGLDVLNNLVDHKVCVLAFAIVTHKDINVDSLTKEQIQGIFQGKYTNWSQLGGGNLPILVVNRPRSSGTRATFIETIMDGKSEQEGLGTIQDSSGSVEKTISSTPGAISYIALSYLTEEKRQNLEVLKIDNVEALKENIVSKKYPFWSYEHMYTNGEPKGVTKAFLDYMMSKENKPLIEKLGYIPAIDMK